MPFVRRSVVLGILGCRLALLLLFLFFLFLLQLTQLLRMLRRQLLRLLPVLLLKLLLARSIRLLFCELLVLHFLLLLHSLSFHFLLSVQLLLLLQVLPFESRICDARRGGFRWRRYFLRMNCGRRRPGDLVYCRGRSHRHVGRCFVTWRRWSDAGPNHRRRRGRSDSHGSAPLG